MSLLVVALKTLISTIFSSWFEIFCFISEMSLSAASISFLNIKYAAIPLPIVMAKPIITPTDSRYSFAFCRKFPSVGTLVVVFIFDAASVLMMLSVSKVECDFGGSNVGSVPSFLVIEERFSLGLFLLIDKTQSSQVLFHFFSFFFEFILYKPHFS